MTSYGPAAIYNVYQKNNLKKQRDNTVVWVAFLAALMIPCLTLPSMAGAADAGTPDFKLPSGPKFKIDETKWMSVGMGFRGSGVWVENRGTGN